MAPPERKSHDLNILPELILMLFCVAGLIVSAVMVLGMVPTGGWLA